MSSAAIFAGAAGNNLMAVGLVKMLTPDRLLSKRPGETAQIKCGDAFADGNRCAEPVLHRQSN